MSQSRARRDLAARWRKAVNHLHVYKRGKERAVHKPLLTLWLLARAGRGGSHAVRFEELDEPLTSLLREFGPPRKKLSPEYPFWHLQTDQIWLVRDAPSLRKKKSGGSPPRGVLLDARAVGEVPQGLWHALTIDAELREELTERLLNEFWPGSLHESIRQAAGLPEAGLRRTRTPTHRDPEFRPQVLRAYEYRCAVCGYDGRLTAESFALEAAHVRWHCEGGPDVVENGLALCTFHHNAFDRGAVGISENGHVLISAAVHGGDVVQSWLIRFAGERLREPQPGQPPPSEPHAAWHRSEVFRTPARVAS